MLLGATGDVQNLITAEFIGVLDLIPDAATYPSCIFVAIEKDCFAFFLIGLEFFVIDSKEVVD